MQWTTWVALGLLLGAGLFPAGADSTKDAPKQLQGIWTVTAAQRDGKLADDVVGHRLSFTGTRFQIQSKDGKLLYESTFRVDPSAKPAAIDFAHAEGTLKGKTWKGIYALEGDSLRICDNAPDLDRDRPTVFEAKTGSGHVLVRLQRASRKRLGR